MSLILEVREEVENAAQNTQSLFIVVICYLYNTISTCHISIYFRVIFSVEAIFSFKPSAAELDSFSHPAAQPDGNKRRIIYLFTQPGSCHVRACFSCTCVYHMMPSSPWVCFVCPCSPPEGNTEESAHFAVHPNPDMKHARAHTHTNICPLLTIVSIQLLLLSQYV